MTTLDLRAARLDIRQEADDDTSIVLTFVDAAGDPVPLDGWEFTAPIVTTRGDDAETFTILVEGNTISLGLAGGVLPAGAYRWALIAAAGEAETTWLSGAFSAVVRGSTTRNGSQEATVRLEQGVTVTVALAASGLSELASQVAWLLANAITTPEED